MLVIFVYLYLTSFVASSLAVWMDASDEIWTTSSIKALMKNKRIYQHKAKIHKK